MTNNLQALIRAYAESGKTREQIAIILNKMGIIPELIESGLDMYYPKKMIKNMNIKEKLNLEAKINTLKESLKNYQTNSTKGYYINQIIDICDKYLNLIVAETNQVKIDEVIKNINELKESFNDVINENKKNLESNEINSILRKINEQQIFLTNYTNQNNSAIHKQSHVSLSKSIIRELKPFDWINPVSQFIMEVETALRNNVLSVAVEEAYISLNSSNSKKFYNVGLAKLNEIRNLPEENLRKVINTELSSLRWIPQINMLYEYNIKLSKDINDDSNNVVTKRYSYVEEYNDGFLFSLNKQPYYIKNGTITPFDKNKVNTLFYILMGLEENFRINGSELITSKGKNVFSMSLDENDKPIFKVNGRKLEMKDGNALRQYLLSLGGYKLNEKATVNIMVAAFENLSNIKELDFVRSITSRRHNGLQYNVIKLNENIYINKINKYMGYNTFEKYEKAEDAVKEVKEALNYDISNIVSELLAAERQVNMKYEKQKAEILDRILFLKEKREELSKADQSNQSIKEAIALIVSEIEKYQKMYNKLIENNTTLNKNIIKPGSKVQYVDKIGTVKGWNDSTMLYTVLFDDGSTGEFKEGDLKLIK